METKQPYFLNNELEPIVLRFIEQYGLTRHVNDSMSKLGVACHQIITEQFQVSQEGIEPNRNTMRDEQRHIRSISFELRFTGTSLRPTMRSSNFMNAVPINPWYCMEEKKTYSVDLHVTCELEVTLVMDNNTIQTRRISVPEHRLCAIPIDIGGVYCSTNGLTRQQIYQERSDPDTFRGMYIVGGGLFCIHTRGFGKFNTMHVSRNAYRNEVSRASIITREAIFKNSYQVVLRHLTSGLVTIEVATYPFEDHPIPVHLFFYMLGITNDVQIAEMVVMSREDNDETRMLRQALKTSHLQMMTDAKYKLVHAVRVPAAIMEWYYDFSMIDRKVSERASVAPPDAAKKVNSVSAMLDRMFLVNQTSAGCIIGYEEAAAGGVAAHELRGKKARILASMIHSTIMTSKQQVPGTDRDHIAGMNMQTPAVLLARTLKTTFHDEVVKKLREDLIAVFTSQDVDSIDLKHVVQARFNKLRLSEKFEKEIKAIQDKNAAVDVDRVIQSEAMQPIKSRAHALSALRTIVVKGIQSKASDRSREIRQAHPSYAEFICYITSPDTGENVGMPKQLAIMTSITSYLLPFELQQKVYADPDLVRWIHIDNGDMKLYTHVYINGDWCGGLLRPERFLSKFRAMRRDNAIDRSISIHHAKSNNRIDFWTDDGRLIRPFFIVYNNAAELDAFDEEIAKAAAGARSESERDVIRHRRDSGRPKFRQWIKYDDAWHGRMTRGEVKFEDLITEGVMEYITADEMQDCLLATDHKQLWMLRHDETRQYTHMTIPLSAFGVPALTATLPHLSQPLRHTFQTQMCKQTTGFTTIMEPYLDVKLMHCQMVAHMPVNPTFANAFTDPGGYPVTIAFMCARWNQDDSIVMKESFIARGGFMCTTINKIIVECRTVTEFFGQLEALSSARTANYAKLRNGYHVAVGTVIENGDVVVAKYVKQEQADGSHISIDKSEVYQHHEPAYVTGVFMNEVNGGGRRITVQYRILRVPNTGSKFASRNGNKGVISRIEQESHLPYSVTSGMIADIYINPHSFVSRMLIGEVLTDWLGKVATSEYRVIPVTPFMDLDFGAIHKQLKAAGRDGFGLEAMRDGRTGMVTKALFVATTTRQCLQKFAEAEASARSTGKLSPVTRQSLMGAQNSGGQRSGEMEMWVTGGHGTSAVLDEYQHFGNTYFEMPVCAICHQRAIYNNEPHPKTGRPRNIYKCLGCREKARIVRVRTKFMTNSLVSYLESAGLRIDLETEEFMHQQMR